MYGKRKVDKKNSLKIMSFIETKPYARIAYLTIHTCLTIIIKLTKLVSIQTMTHNLEKPDVHTEEWKEDEKTDGRTHTHRLREDTHKKKVFTLPIHMA